MNKQLLTIISVAALGLTSCDDKEFYPSGDTGTPVAAGTELVFGTVLDNGASNSRTNYGGEITADDGKTYIPIHWTSGDDDQLDQIFIFCPEGDEGHRSATYRVRPVSENSFSPAAAEKIDETKYVAAGKEGEEHRFHSFYPVDAIYMDKFSDGSDNETDDESDNKFSIESGIVAALEPMNQTVTFRGNTDGNGILLAEPDMKNCHMAAYNPQTPTNGGSISLTFSAIPTMFDITLSAPEAEEECTVESIVIKCNTDASIAGGYKWDFKNRIATPTKISGLGAEEPASQIEVILMDESGSEPASGVKLSKGQFLNLKAFAVPDPNVKEITVEIFSSNGKMWTKTLTTTNENKENILQPGNVHKVKFGALDNKFSYEEQTTWMAKLSDDILITQMSIPGSVASLSYELAGESPYRHQSATLSEQFDAGIRAFRCHIALAEGTDSHVPATTGKKISVTFDGTVNTDRKYDLGSVIHELHQEMQGRSDKEFCVLVLSDLFGDDGSQKTRRDYENLFATLNQTVSALAKAEIVVDNLESTTTLGQVRGKILIYYAMNAELGLCDSKFSNPKENPLYEQYCYNDVAYMEGGCYAGWYKIEQWLSKNVESAYPPSAYYNYGIINNEYILGWQNWDETASDKSRNSHAVGLGLDRWSNMEGAPILLSWWTRASLVRPQVYPITFGKIGTMNYILSPTGPANLQDGWTNGDYNDYDEKNNAIIQHASGKWTFANPDKVGLASWNALVTTKNMAKIDSLGKAEAAKKGEEYTGLNVSDYTGNNFRKGVVSHSNIDRTLLKNGTYDKVILDEHKGWPYGMKTPGTVWACYVEQSPLVKGTTIPYNAVNDMWAQGTAMSVYKEADKNVIFATYLAATPESGNTLSLDLEVYNGFFSTRQVINTTNPDLWGFHEEYSIPSTMNAPFGLMFLSHVPKVSDKMKNDNFTQMEPDDKIMYRNKELIKLLIEHNNKFVSTPTTPTD